MKVLIVDDSKAILLMVEEMLSKLGHEACTAINGIEALKILANESYDLVLLDWNMPEMSGLELLVKNKEENLFDAPVFMMTTEKSPQKIQQALENGASDYIMKPFTPDILESKIEILRDLMGAI